jgi:hypothetical protein
MNSTIHESFSKHFLLWPMIRRPYLDTKINLHHHALTLNSTTNQEILVGSPRRT